MKRRFFTTLALFAALALTSCGGKSGGQQQGDQSSEQPHVHQAAEGAEWQNNATKHWKECEAGDGAKVDEASHNFKDVAAESVAATCAAPGKEVKICTICGYKSETALPQLEHNYVANGDATGKVHPEKCNSGCETKAYRFDISEAAGWNKATTKWNAKTTDTSNNQVEASWAVEAGQLPAGKYQVYLEATMSRDSHSSRYLFNENKTVNPKKPDGTDYPDQSSSSPDTADESPWRYYFAVNGVDVYPDTSKTLGEIGYHGGDGAEKVFGLVLSEITIPENITSFSAKHGDIGYSLTVSAVRLVEIKQAA